MSAYNDLHVWVRRPHQADHLRVRLDDGIRCPPLERVIRAQHELHNIRLRGLQPLLEVVIGNINTQPSRVTLVASVKVGRRRLAVLGIVGHGTDKVDFVC